MHHQYWGNVLSMRGWISVANFPLFLFCFLVNRNDVWQTTNHLSNHFVLCINQTMYSVNMLIALFWDIFLWYTSCTDGRMFHNIWFIYLFKIIVAKEFDIPYFYVHNNWSQYHFLLNTIYIILIRYNNWIK